MPGFALWRVCARIDHRAKTPVLDENPRRAAIDRLWRAPARAQVADEQ
jgi:hypothetical protein